MLWETEIESALVTIELSGCVNSPPITVQLLQKESLLKPPNNEIFLFLSLGNAAYNKPSLMSPTVNNSQIQTVSCENLGIVFFQLWFILSIFVANKELVNENDVLNENHLAMTNTKNQTYACPRLLCVKLALRILLCESQIEKGDTFNVQSPHVAFAVLHPKPRRNVVHQKALLLTSATLTYPLYIITRLGCYKSVSSFHGGLYDHITITSLLNNYFTQEITLVLWTCTDIL